MKVLSVGGSIIAPAEPDAEFLKDFRAEISDYLAKNPEEKLIMVAGGGGPARMYQKAYKEVMPQQTDEELDWLGVMATRLNAELLKGVMGDFCLDPVVTDPTAEFDFTGRVLVAAGWKPGFSSDNDAVLLAERFGADMVVNLSNIEKVYSDDPRVNPEAQPLDTISWAEFREMVGDTWTPGKNTPFDPVASKRAEELGLTVICAKGGNIKNTRAILDGKEFIGTRIGN